MIDKQYGTFILACDYCSNDEQGFDSFNDAAEYVGQSDWRRTYINGEWINICPDCMEGAYPDY